MNKAGIAILLLGLGAQADTQNVAFEAGYLAWTHDRQRPGYDSHLSRIVAHNNEHRIDESGECHETGDGIAELIFIHDECGFVIAALPRFNDLKSQCFADLYHGQKFPPPPFHPYLEYIQFR